MIRRVTALLPILCCLFAGRLYAAPSTGARNFLDKPDDWFRTPEAAQVADDILSYQAPQGGWPKNVDTAGGKYVGDLNDLHATYDNSATTDELRFVARMVGATSDRKYRDSFNRGLKYVLDGQYPNGGWPQYAPPGTGYARYITFNDGAMVRLMFFVKEVATDAHYAFLDNATKNACTKAWDRGVECILKCQIKVNGKLTAWCAQHDEVTLEPRGARAFELAGLSGCESIGICHALMSIEKPSAEIIAAVDAAVAWLDASKLLGIRVEDRPTDGAVRGFERYVVKDPAAPPMWARFYDIETNKPFYSDRDGVKKWDIADIGIERRTGYQWLKYWPKNLIEKEYPAWKAKHGALPSPEEAK